MPRKSKQHRKNDVNPATGLPRRFRVPREMRVVTASRVRTKECDQIVPQIRLRGAWLAQLGFRRGTRFLILADTARQITLAVITRPSRKRETI
jgi:hypothetical protein